MAVPVVEGFTTYSVDTTRNDIPLTKPSGVATDDLLMLIVVNEDNVETTANWDTHSGWTRHFNHGNTSVDTHIAMYTRIADGTEGATETVTFTGGADYVCGWYLRISGADTTTPIHLVGSPDQSGSNRSSATGPSITTTEDDCLAFGLVVFDGADSSPFSVSGTGWPSSIPTNQDLYTGTAGSRVSGAWVTKSMGTAGATSAVTITSGNASDQMQGIQWAVLGASGGVTATVASTLAGVSSATSASQSVSATVSATLAGVSSATSASQSVSATVADTLAGVSGAVSANLPAQVADTLAGVTASVSATQEGQATVADTLAGVSASISASQAVSATVADTLAGATSATSASQAVSATVADTLAGVTAAVSASSGSTVTATVASTLAGATASVSATQESQGSVADTLAGVSASVSASQSVSATVASTLDGVSSAISASSGNTATVASTLGGVTASVSATQSVDGSVAATLAGVSSSVAASQAVSATVSDTLAGVGAAVSADSGETVTATVADTLQGVTAALSASQQVSATVADTLSGVSASASGSQAVSGTVTATLAGVSATINSGSEVLESSVSATLAGVTASVSATQTVATFKPPTVTFRGAKQDFDITPRGRAWERFYKRMEPLDQGRSVWRDSGGAWHTGVPTMDDLNSALVYYLGGRTHTITEAEAVALETAGYTVQRVTT